MTELSYRPAVAAEAGSVAALINSAYRGESSRAGWTTEADFLVGLRTDEDEIRDLIGHDGSVILLCERADEIIGCVHLRRDGDSAYLGMFVVRPDLQGAGIGKRFMAAAEDLVRREWDARRITMTVLSLRDELIAFYERRGYRRTGRFTPFPADSRSTPMVQDLRFETLEKDLPAAPQPAR
ncbi:MAG TPA: GNAT family N-acetyltransferase [Actinomycetota bacterium]|nr:GNAT family N-acetyltransferase [Actinomycetota bacterium]